jgi:hypothetical protein
MLCGIIYILPISNIEKFKKPSSIIEEGFFVNCFNSLTLVTESQMHRDKYE